MKQLITLLFFCFILSACKKEKIKETPVISTTKPRKVYSEREIKVITAYLTSVAKFEESTKMEISKHQFRRDLSNLIGEFTVLNEIWKEETKPKLRHSLAQQLQGYNLAQKLWDKGYISPTAKEALKEGEYSDCIEIIDGLISEETLSKLVSKANRKGADARRQILQIINKPGL